MKNRMRMARFLMAIVLGAGLPTAWAAAPEMGRSEGQVRWVRVAADDAIEIEIKALYEKDPRVELGFIRVNSRNRVVTLNGSVLTQYERAAAEHLAGSLKEVKGVVNEIAVVPAVNYDFDLKKKIRKNVLENPAMDVSRFAVEVHDGEVHLFGFVNSPEAKKDLETLVEGMPEVRGLRSRIVVQNG